MASRRLVGTSWVLARLDDPTGSVSPFPSGEETLTFEATTVSDNHGNNAFVRVEPETIRFQMWVDDLVIVLPSRPPGSRV